MPTHNDKEYWKKFTGQEIKDWYSRLATVSRLKSTFPKSLSADLLEHWLNPPVEDPENKEKKGTKYTFSHVHIVNYIKYHKEIIENLQNHVRNAFLTIEKVRLARGKNIFEKIGGILPRILRKGKFQNIIPDMDDDGNYTMFYQEAKVFELVDYLLTYRPLGNKALALEKKIAAGKAISKNEELTIEEKIKMDLFTSLHKFGIRSDVAVRVTQKSLPTPVKTRQQNNISIPIKYSIQFVSWETKVYDLYDWNFELGLEIINPDYQNPFNVKKPFAPDYDLIIVHHGVSAKRLIDEGYASIYDVESEAWDVKTDTKMNKKIIKPIDILIESNQIKWIDPENEMIISTNSIDWVDQ